jgi:hypothetical protein
MAGAAKDRTSNLVTTPYRLSKDLVDHAGDISGAEDALLFVPQQVGGIVGDLLSGVGELTVTGVRISKGVAGTACSGLGCVEKARDDIWSGVNSLAGKHNAARRLHREFGTDPGTDNERIAERSTVSPMLRLIRARRLSSVRDRPELIM